MARFIFTSCFFVSLMIFGAMARGKKTPLLRTILFGSALVSLWLFCDAFPYYVDENGIILKIYYVKMIAVILFTPSVYLFTVEYTGYFSDKKYMSHGVLVIPVLLLISMATNSVPFEFIKDLSVRFHTEFPVYTYYPQIGFYIYIGYSVFIAGVSIILLAVKAIRTPKNLRMSTVHIATSLIICLSASSISLHIQAGSDLWRGDISDVTSIFLFTFIVVVFVVTQRTPTRYEDRVMQVEMSRGFRENEYRLFLQPQYSWNGESYELTGAEGLIRWYRDGKVLYRPDQFIPVAERNDMILPIGNWVIDEIFRINKELRNRNIEIKLSINVSSVQLEHDDFMTHLESVCKEYKDIPIDLVTEVTESTMIDQVDNMTGKLKKIRSMGICLALDDFGTGYSSLSYLKELPIDYLKIDKSFIDDVLTNHYNLTPHILSIAKTLGLKTVAEGTETLAQVEFLKTQCEYIQGYYFSKPIDEESFLKLAEPDVIEEISA